MFIIHVKDIHYYIGYRKRRGKLTKFSSTSTNPKLSDENKKKMKKSISVRITDRIDLYILYVGHKALMLLLPLLYHQKQSKSVLGLGNIMCLFNMDYLTDRAAGGVRESLETNFTITLFFRFV